MKHFNRGWKTVWKGNQEFVSLLKLENYTKLSLIPKQWEKLPILHIKCNTLFIFIAIKSGNIDSYT